MKLPEKEKKMKSEKTMNTKRILAFTIVIAFALCLVALPGANAATTTTVTVEVKNSQETGIDGVPVRYYDGSWHTFGTTGTDGAGTGKCSLSLTVGNYAFDVSYAYATQQKWQVVSGPTDTVSFQTTEVTMKVLAHDGTTVLTGTNAQYYTGTWYTFGSGTTTTSIELLPGHYAFKVSLAGTTQQKWQDVSGITTDVVFQTTLVTIELKDHSGGTLTGSNPQYYPDTWLNFDSGTTTTSKELLPGHYAFRVTYKGMTQQKWQDVSGITTDVVFQTTLVTMKILASDGTTELPGTNAQYYPGTWLMFDGGSTTSSMELLPANYAFGVTYNGKWEQKWQDVGVNKDVEFQTGQLFCTDGSISTIYLGGYVAFTHPSIELLPGQYWIKLNDGSGTWITINAGEITFFPNQNFPPVADAGGPYEVNEGTEITLDASGSYDPEGMLLEYSWDLNYDGVFDTGWLTVPTCANTWYDDWTGYFVVVKVSDGMLTDTDTSPITVRNVAPSVNAGSDQPVNEGSVVNIDGSFTDPGKDEWTATVDYGDGSGVQPLSLNPDKTFSPSHTYTEDGSYVVTITVEDDDKGVGATQIDVIVLDLEPQAAFSWSPLTPNEGSLVTFTDGSTSYDNIISWDWNFDDGATSTAQNPTHTYVDNDVYTVTLTVTDNDGSTAHVSNEVTVNNVAPTITVLTGPTAPVPVTTGAHFDVTFTDPGTQDTHTAFWYWDWDELNPGTPESQTLTVGQRSFTNSHQYGDPGIYQVMLEIGDGDGGSDSRLYELYIVVYDSQGGFVTGGGWIMSPLGAYVVKPELTGKATFGFVSKYQKGANLPTGNTEFVFHAAGMNFKSTSYDWLVVAGFKAQYKGTGTINGKGEYGFMLTAIDGDLKGKGNPDLFRIKIWDKASEVIVYDNQSSSSDSADPTTAISGGSIVVHK